MYFYFFRDTYLLWNLQYDFIWLLPLLQKDSMRNIFSSMINAFMLTHIWVIDTIDIIDIGYRYHNLGYNI